MCETDMQPELLGQNQIVVLGLFEISTQPEILEDHDVDFCLRSACSALELLLWDSQRFSAKL